MTSFRAPSPRHSAISAWPWSRVGLPERELWATRGSALTDAARDVRSAVPRADASREGNPRARSNRRNLVVDFEDLAVQVPVCFHVRNLTEVFCGHDLG